MAITVLENNSAIAPRVLWSGQVCVCTGALSRSSVLSQVISSCPVWVALRNSGSRRLRAEAPVRSPQSISFFSTLHHVVVHYERTRTPLGGFAVLSLASAARLRFRLSLLPPQGIETEPLGSSSQNPSLCPQTPPRSQLS